MIGKITKGASFRGCISYVLEDKKNLSKAELMELLEKGLSIHNRSEVILYNKCFGEKSELISDFNEVRRLNEQVEKPVLHISLRLADGEQLRKDQWMEAAEICAQKLGFADHQYIGVLHHDSKGQHIHMVINRIDFDGKLLSDAHDFRKIAELSRQLEHKFDLQKVLSPRKFLPNNKRLLPRLDQRKIQLQEDVRSVLQQSENYPSFEFAMLQLGYQVIKGRGIRFVDKKKVSTKGSEIGYPLAKIEKIFNLKLRYLDAPKRESNSMPLERNKITRSLTRKDYMPIGQLLTDGVVQSSQAIGHLIIELMRPEMGATTFGHITESEYEKEQKKKKRSRGRSI